jgi:hypothetical protein
MVTAIILFMGAVATALSRRNPVRLDMVHRISAAGRRGSAPPSPRWHGSGDKKPQVRKSDLGFWKGAAYRNRTDDLFITSVRNGFAGILTCADSRRVVPRGLFVAGFRGLSLTDSLTAEPARSDRKEPLQKRGRHERRPQAHLDSITLSQIRQGSRMLPPTEYTVAGRWPTVRCGPICRAFGIRWVTPVANRPIMAQANSGDAAQKSTWARAAARHSGRPGPDRPDVTGRARR